MEEARRSSLKSTTGSLSQISKLKLAQLQINTTMKVSHNTNDEVESPAGQSGVEKTPEKASSSTSRDSWSNKPQNWVAIVSLVLALSMGLALGLVLGLHDCDCVGKKFQVTLDVKTT
eukprot:scaffold1140_cov157-Amphora_coffeaeformis.AAC.2